MINIIFLFTAMMLFIYGFGCWLIDDIAFKKVLPFLLISILMTVGVKYLPKASSHLEDYDKEGKARILIPEGFIIETFQIKSDSKWLWTEDDGKIVYIVEKKR